MEIKPSATLKSRTFVGLILSQFLAAFNDQCIHAAAMFYAIRTSVLTEAEAITLMPILFYIPWAIFCTLAGYLADRFSKRNSLVFWKFAEIAITLVALAGFWIGTERGNAREGAMIVLSTVFLMGMHSAFFVPAKYGVMPEILHANLLSKGNGVLESTSFFAVILGTVSGGILSAVFARREYYIGVILVGLALLGALASLLIRKMPAANPLRPFPWNLFKPLAENLKTLWQSRPLALAVLGIAFFTFMVAYMRATVYMHGEANHWVEFKTSLVVASVGLGIGLGSYLAGLFSGHKVELGLVPLGAIGMILATFGAGLAIFWMPGLVGCIIAIGFFAGFYLVPLYTLLQHRAPKKSKGDLIATSNFINVTGAITASLLFFALEIAAQKTGLAKPIEQKEVAEGILEKRVLDHGRLVSFEIDQSGKTLFKPMENNPAIRIRRKSLFQPVHRGEEVKVSKYRVGEIVHYEIRPADMPLEPAYDQEEVPRYLFMGASFMTLAILILLLRQLPDFFVRMLLWLRSQGRYRLKVIGLENLPSDGPVILATNCDRLEDCMHVVAATDRRIRFILLERPLDASRPTRLLRYLAWRTGLVALRPGDLVPANWDRALQKAGRTLDKGNLLGLTMVSQDQPVPEGEKFLRDLPEGKWTALLPVYCGPAGLPPSLNGRPPRVRRLEVIIGQPFPPGANGSDIHMAIRYLASSAPPDSSIVPREEIARDRASAAIPGAADASPSGPAGPLPGNPSPG